jgi:AcrR family transcriptional regulator
MKSVNSKTTPDTKEKILDAAEALFAAKGFRGTTMRAITGKADVNLAAANYHFGAKQSLLEEVIKRRIIPLNQIRRERLEEVRSDARKKKRAPDVKNVMRAFIEPTLQFKDSSPGAKNFFTFIGRSFTDPDDTVRQVFLKFIKPIFLLLSEITTEALPQHPRELIFWRLMFSMGALFHTINLCGNIKDDFMGMKCETDTESLVNHIIPFVTAGMEAK